MYQGMVSSSFFSFTSFFSIHFYLPFTPPLSYYDYYYYLKTQPNHPSDKAIRLFTVNYYFSLPLLSPFPLLIPHITIVYYLCPLFLQMDTCLVYFIILILDKGLAGRHEREQ